MNLKGKRKRSGKLPPFVALTWELLNSAAYRSLGPTAAKLLPYFLGKPKINPTYPEYHATEFELTYREAGRLGFATSTYSRCLNELVAKGFVDPVWRGGLRGDGKSSNRFRLSKRWRQFGKEGFVGVRWKGFATP